MITKFGQSLRDFLSLWTVEKFLIFLHYLISVENIFIIKIFSFNGLSLIIKMSVCQENSNNDYKKYL